jgi:hypothetical protein
MVRTKIIQVKKLSRRSVSTSRAMGATHLTVLSDRQTLKFSQTWLSRFPRLLPNKGKASRAEQQVYETGSLTPVR